MMLAREAARRSGNFERAKNVRQDDAIIARAMHIAGWLIGISFGLMLFIGILAG